MRKRTQMLALTILMTVSICFSGMASAKAAAKKSSTKQWANAYMKVIQKANREDKSWRTGSSYKYSLIYFNNDSIPELVVDDPGYRVSMYTYDKKVYTVMDHWGYGAFGVAGYAYLPKKNCLYNIDNDYAGAVQYLNYRKMKKHKMVNRYSKSLYIYHFNDKNKNGWPDRNELNGKTYYYYGKKKISKKKFKSYQVSGKYQSLSGTRSYTSMKKLLTQKGTK